MVESLSHLLDRSIAANRQLIAEDAVRLLLKEDSTDARSAVEARLDRLAPVTDTATIKAMLDGLSRRGLGLWPGWLKALDAQSAHNAMSPGAVERLLTRAWRYASTTKLDEGGAERALAELRSALAAVRVLTEDVNWNRSELVDLVSSAFEGPALDDETARTRSFLLAVAQTFVNTGFVTGTEVATASSESIAMALEHPFPTQPENSPAPALVSEHILQWTPWISERADAENRRRLRAAVEASPWVPRPARDTLLLVTAAAMAKDGEEAGSPLTADEIASLATEHGADFAKGVSVWLLVFADSPSELIKGIRPLLHQPLPEPIALALEEYSDRGSDRDRLELVAPVLRQSLTATPHPTFLRAARFSDADVTGATDILIQLFEAATSNAQREIVLQLWVELKPLDPQQRRRLVERVLIPLARSNKQALDLALRHLNLALPPPYGTKTLLRKTLQDCASGRKQKRRVEERLERAGLFGPRRLLGRRSE